MIKWVFKLARNLFRSVGFDVVRYDKRKIAIMNPPKRNLDMGFDAFADMANKFVSCLSGCLPYLLDVVCFQSPEYSSA